MLNPWFQFLVSASLIVLAGNQLTKSTAVIARNTGIGAVWAGALLLPFATSLPEAVTTMRAVLINAPDLAFGNIVGSCLYNLALLFIIDLFIGKKSLTSQVRRNHILPATLSIIAISILLLGVLRVIVVPVGWIGLESLLIIGLYFGGHRLVYRLDRKQFLNALTEDSSSGTNETKKAIIRFAAASVVILVAGTLLTDASDLIALRTGLGQTFVGAIFLAISTSLPETVTTISALKLGYADMAVANVFGANLMNLLIIALADIVYLTGPIGSMVSNVHALPVIMVILLTSVVIVGLVYRSGKVVFRFGLDTLIVIIGYVITIVLLLQSAAN